MRKESIEILIRTIERERAARKQAESILEEKSLENYEIIKRLKNENEDLKEIIEQKSIELKGVFENIVDAFVVLDFNGNVLKMNDAAITMFGHTKGKDLNLLTILHPDDYEYTQNAFKK